MGHRAFGTQRLCPFVVDGEDSRVRVRNGWIRGMESDTYWGRDPRERQATRVWAPSGWRDALS